jgi:peroxiredoxin
MERRAEGQGFNFDYLYDEDQSVARALGSERTPEVFLFDRDRRLVYHGAIDDSRDERAVEQQYLRDALDAVLAGREPAVAETPPTGCSVKWRS